MKITNNTTNIKQHKCLQKISEISYLKKKQLKIALFHSKKKIDRYIQVKRKINHPTLPFREARSITTIKGRDLAWRYLLKALPKHHGENCHSCKEEESSMHIFFECKSIKQDIDSIYQKVCKDYNNIYHGPWSEKVLGKLLTPFSSNLIGAIMESIWYRRNQIKFNDNTTIITENQIIHKNQKSESYRMG
ncbi:hypothetical protein ACTFIT_007334 [Dictyostelium discoideum]